MKFTFNPFAVWFIDPNADQIKAKQLREAQAGRAEHAANAEYHKAMRNMLDKRIERLQAEMVPEDYECHITVSVKDSEVATNVAERGGWKTSEIARDPLLGDDTHFYLTCHAKDYAFILGKMKVAVEVLQSAGVTVLRQKVEKIVYDTKGKKP